MASFATRHARKKGLSQGRKEFLPGAVGRCFPSSKRAILIWIREQQASRGQSPSASSPSNPARGVCCRGSGVVRIRLSQSSRAAVDLLAATSFAGRVVTAGGGGTDRGGVAAPGSRCAAGRAAHGHRSAEHRCDAIENRVGEFRATGAGVAISQVEAPTTTSSTYFVDTGLSDFAGKTIVDATGGGDISSHATNVGQNMYGNAGIAPGVTSVDVYNANDWLNSGFLQTESPQAPNVETNKIENHSWIADFTNTDNTPDVVTATDVIRRLDYVIDRDGVVAVVGVNNGIATSLPQVLANSYNAIAVGRSDGGSSLGPSTIDGLGRSKPDLVAPAYNTSVATGWVSGRRRYCCKPGAAIRIRSIQRPSNRF